MIDPYVMNESKLKDDTVALWPPVKLGKIYSYFSDMPRQVTREKINSYKSFTVFNYYIWYHL